jgi:hypothetical protein
MYTKEQLKGKILAAAKNLNQDYLTESDYISQGNTVAPLKRLFGSVQSAFISFGLKPPPKRKSKITEEVIKDKIKAISIKLGKNWLSVEDFKANSDISVGPLIRLFGSIKEAFRAAGF